MDIQTLLRSKTFFWILFSLGALVILVGVFKAGEIVGFHKAAFSYQWGQRYYGHMRDGRRGALLMPFQEEDFLMSHSIFGSIVAVSSSSLVVTDRDGAEKTIQTTSHTLIKHQRESITLTDLNNHDRIIVLGTPNDTGQVIAKLIRVLPDNSFFQLNNNSH